MTFADSDHSDAQPSHIRENMDVTKDQFTELLLQMLETEQGGVKVYETALRCVVNEDLEKEWEKRTI
jgi:hypothetical protein